MSSSPLWKRYGRQRTDELVGGGSNGARFPSPLRYPGGKGKIANYLKLLILENGLVGTSYVEPYAGGAGAALTLLFEEYVDQIHINDIDPGIAALWRSILDETDRFVRAIASVELTMDEWFRQRTLQEVGASGFELGFSTFFLNRTNRSGIITGGPIGGPEQMGKWGIDARYNRSDLIRRVKKIARFRNRIQVTDRDAVEVIESYEASNAGVLIYADPPYFVRGGDLYRSFYGADDHIEVAAAIQSLRVPWMVSYDDVEAVRALYRGRKAISYSLSYSAANRYRGSEVLFLSDRLNPPDVQSPAGIEGNWVAQALLSTLNG